MLRCDNPYYNGSGYADPTAAAAINTISKEIKMQTLPQAYEIWLRDYEDTPVIILAAHGNLIQYTKLLDHVPNKDEEIMINGLAVNVNFIAYGFADNSMTFKRTLNAAEVETVQEAIADNFGITAVPQTVTIDEVNELKGRLAMAEKEAEELRIKCTQLESVKNDELLKKIESQHALIDVLLESIMEYRNGKK